MREGRLRPIRPVDQEEDSDEVYWLRLISAWSVAVLAVIAVAAALYLAREPLIPVVTAFVVGVMLSPAAGALEERGAPRLLTAALMVVTTAFVIGFVVALIATPMADLAGRIPQIGAKLQIFPVSWTGGAASNFRSASIHRPPSLPFRCRAPHGFPPRSGILRRPSPHSSISWWCCSCSFPGGQI